MRRVGPWVLAAGMALLVAGIASTALDGGDAGEPVRESRVALPAGAAVSIGRSRVDRVAIEAGGEAVLRYRLMPLVEGERTDPRVEWRQEDGTWLLDVEPGGMAYGTRLRLPSGLSRLSGRALTIEAEVPVESLRVEGGQVAWSGDAGTLEMLAIPVRSRRCGEEGATSSLRFGGGRVGELRIASAQGEVSLGGLEGVGSVELRLAPGVALRVARVSDLERIAILPFEGPVPAPLYDPDGPRAAEEPCAAGDDF